MRNLFCLLVLSFPIAPVLGAPAPKSAPTSWKSAIPGACQVAAQLRVQASGIRWKTLTRHEEKEVRLELVSALSLLGRPDWALSFTDDPEERDEIWRVYARAAAARDDIAGANVAFAKIEAIEPRLDALVAMSRAHIRAGRLALARPLVARVEKALPQAFADRQTYSYIADLWRRAGDRSAARRLLAKRPAEESGLDFSDSLGPERFFAVRAGTFAGVNFAAATPELALEMVQT